ncbi:2,5-didehydrogluconate reductase DkgB [Alteromonas sp. H39]|uniref:2,5-didehydrogluconate reductase DkgB n=1 Tax=Alteromonas sp. H39 TaxID=3389876 RepID=UPI0039DFA94B
MTALMNMPELGVGTFRLEDQACNDSVTTALDIGFRHIDTAQIYGNEAAVGKAIQDSDVSRNSLFVTTKVWNNKLNVREFIPSVKESLAKLQMNSVDLLLIHWPSPANGEPMEEYLGELAKAKKQGLTRKIGVSNFTIHHLEKAIAILGEGEIATNQVEVHPYLINEKLRSYCNDKGIHVTAYMPFAVGKVLQDDTIQAIAQAHNVSAAEVVIAWELAHGMATIPSSTKREHLETNYKGSELVLSDEEVSRIDALNKGDRQATPDFAPDWD